MKKIPILSIIILLISVSPASDSLNVSMASDTQNAFQIDTILLAAILLFITWMLLSISSLKKEVKKMGNFVSDELINELKKAMQKAIDSLSERITNLENEIQQLKNAGLNKGIGNSSNGNSKEVVPLPPQPSSSPAAPKPECIYFTVPIKGAFPKAKSLPAFEENKSFYRFEKFPGDETRAYVFVETGPKAAGEISYNTDIHNEACFPENPCPDNPSGIETTKPGEAYLDGDKWVIKDKVKIRYID
jgi:hypothetical protein